MRAVHLACFMLLLSAIASAETRGSMAGAVDPHVQYASFLMQQGNHAANAPVDAFPCGTPAALRLDLPVGARVQVAIVWGVKPPLAHGAEMQAFTANRA